MIFQVQVMTTDPIVFYFTQGTHCTRGMYGVLIGAGDQTLKSYRDSITADKPGVAPNTIGGGRLLPNSVANILSAPNTDSATSVKGSILSLAVGFGLYFLKAR